MLPAAGSEDRCPGVRPDEPTDHQEYGGRGYPADGLAVCSLGPGATQVGGHELGHALGLTNEYDTGFDDRTTHIRDYPARPFHWDTTNCFVASAVYGDRGHPGVQALRWRDRHLEGDPPARHAMAVLDAVYQRAGLVCARLTGTRPRLARVLRGAVLGPAAATLRRLEQRRDASG